MVQRATSEANTFDLWASPTKQWKFCCSTQNYTVAYKKQNQLSFIKLKKISYLLSQFRLNYINTKKVFRQKIKMVVCSALQTISMKSGMSWNLGCSVSMFENDHFAWIISIWGLRLDMLFYNTLLPFLLLLIGRLQHPQAFTITRWSTGMLAPDVCGSHSINC